MSSKGLSTPKLFQPFKLTNNITLNHRVIFPPLTRYRASRLTHVPINPMVKTHYEQRSRTPGTLLITEATYVAAKAGGVVNVPGIWNKEQISAWKEVTDTVHANGSYIFVQLWGLGRAARPEQLHEENPSFDYVAPSPIPLSRPGSITPRELTIPEIKEYVERFAQAARNAMEAGFDGVEIHNANGYLLDQFVKEVSNQREDEYGGSIENRSRLTIEVIKAVVDVIGEEKTGIRFSPWGINQDMKLDNPIPQFTYLVEMLKEKFPNMAYLHLIEPLASGRDYADKSNDFLRDIWKPRPLITAGRYVRGTGIKMAETDNELIGYGEAFIANPDLPRRLQHDLSLNAPEKDTFYTRGDDPTAAVGYIDYPFYGEVVEKQQTGAFNLPLEASEPDAIRRSASRNCCLNIIQAHEDSPSKTLFIGYSPALRPTH